MNDNSTASYPAANLDASAQSDQHVNANEESSSQAISWADFFRMESAGHYSAEALKFNGEAI